MHNTLNLFYEEPDGDRWLPFDRYPRRVVRRIVRGPRQPGGMERYYLNLIDGLRRIRAPFRVGPYRHAARHPEELVGIIGKGHLLRDRRWENPILFGPAVFSHPDADREALATSNVRKVLVSCDWMKAMYERSLELPVEVWPSGIDTHTWRPDPTVRKDIDYLVYDKIRWERERLVPALLSPILESLARRGRSCQVIRYGFYKEPDYRALLSRCRAMIFLVEHETQGFAYLQALASGVPLLAWDRGGDWQDPEFFPDRVKFGPVSSVPYWDDRCGLKFATPEAFENQLDEFDSLLGGNGLAPRDYVLENLTLEQCARTYARIYEDTVRGN